VARLRLLFIFLFALALTSVSAGAAPEEEPPELELNQIVVEDSLLYPPGETEVKTDAPQVGVSADSGDLLKTVPGVSGVRMGGHGVDPVIRGQMGNRINIILDGAYVQSGCPNRMDPPTSYAAFESYDKITVLNPERVLKELHRVLKPEGVLSLSDHHMKDEAILAGVTWNSWFGLSRKGSLTYVFTKRLPAGKGGVKCMN
jgi:SAM-dependent methyltransferase